MDFRPSERGEHWRERVRRFMDERVLPRSADYWAEGRANPKVQPPTMEALKAEARDFERSA